MRGKRDDRLEVCALNNSGYSATRRKTFPRNEISIVPSELSIIKAFLMISLEFPQSLPPLSIHDAFIWL